MRFLAILWLIFLGCAHAQGIPLNNALSFAPPPSDVSMMFLNNLFGVVEGVLAGSGSQLFGNMMKVFNSAVLALGSIVSTYVLLLGTMHTAHEGEFLGKKWSSILIPVRTTIGISLLIPKTSGYCLIQVFFIWVVVQGIGAADKIWGAALDYLNQGGQIVMQQPSSKDVIGSGSGEKQNQVYMAGIKILAGQVCMKGIEQILRMIQQQLRNSPAMSQPSNTPDDKIIKAFISIDIPDFLGSVNAVTFAQQNSQSPLVLPMPNFSTTDGQGFSALNGICGSISWNSVKLDFHPGGQGSISGDTNFNLSQDDVKAISQSRAVAVQTLYSFLSNVAVAMINNNPIFGNPPTQTATAAFYANLQYGLPNQNGDPEICKDPTSFKPQSDDATLCSTWGAAQGGSNVGILFSGNEFTNAVKAYDAVMAPVFNLQRQMKETKSSSQLRQFIIQNRQDGWMFAGSYFFNLVALSGSTEVQAGDLQDTQSGLEATVGPLDGKSSTLMKAVKSNCNVVGSNGSLCWYFSKFQEPINILQNLVSMINGGSTLPNGCQPELILNSSSMSSSDSGYIKNVKDLNSLSCSSTVYGFAGNSFYFNVPVNKNLDLNTLNFEFPKIEVTKFTMPRQDISPRGWFGIPSLIINLLLDYVLYPLIDQLIRFVDSILSMVMDLIVKNPLEQKIWPMLQTGIQILTKISNNPVVDLANMGAYFIEETINIYMSMLAVSAIGAIPVLTVLGIAVQFILALVMPFLTAWLAFFTTIGFTTCYYVPMLPYIIFIFATLSWLFSIVEAVIAAPLVALAVTTPEGEGIMGKGEQGLMILLNIFLRPSLMIIGYVTAIAMTYVSVWILNSSFAIPAKYLTANGTDPISTAAGINWLKNKYTWPLMLGNVMFLSLYVSTYVTLVQKVFSLIYSVPDKVLRWIGGREEGTGQEVNQWVESTKQKIEEFTKATQGAIVASGANLEKAKENAEQKAEKIKGEYEYIKSKLKSGGGEGDGEAQ